MIAGLLIRKNRGINMRAAVPPTWVHLSGTIDDSKPCHSGTEPGRDDVSLQQIPLGGELLPGGKHLIQRSRFGDHPISAPSVSGFDDETFTQ